MKNTFSWLLGGILAVGGLSLGFWQLIQGGMGVRNVAFYTQDAERVSDVILKRDEGVEKNKKETKDRKSNDAKDDVANSNTGIDLSLIKQFVGTFPLNKYVFKLTVTNNGNTQATNFSIKDYLPANSSLFYASNGGVNNQGVLTWNIASLSAGQSKTVTVRLKRTNQNYFINKAEVCDYDDMDEAQDLDSNPCTMTAAGMPVEDDEGAVRFATGSASGNALTGGMVPILCYPNFTLTDNTAPGAITMQFYPFPLPIGYSITPSACTLVQITDAGEPTGVTYPITMDINGSATYTAIPAGRYAIQCTVTTPSGFPFMCRVPNFTVIEYE